MSDETVVKVENLTRRWPRVVAVDSVSFEVGRGEVFALLGRNGSGKSTTVRCLLGRIRADHGTLRVLGLDPWRRRRDVMASTAVVPENPDVPPSATAAELEWLLSRLHRRWDGAGFRERLERLSVPLSQCFRELSKGQQRQLALSAALATRPEVLVLDDPTLGLDPVARRELFEELVTDLAERGTTVFMTTHDLAGVESVADRVGVLDRGRLVLTTGLDELRRAARCVRVSAVADGGEEVARRRLLALGAILIRPIAGGLEGVVLGWCDDEGLVEPDLALAPASLEDVMTAVTTASSGDGSRQEVGA